MCVDPWEKSEEESDKAEGESKGTPEDKKEETIKRKI